MPKEKKVCVCLQNISALEAMSNYCPVIASNIEVYRETLQNYAYFFDPNDAEDLKNKLESLVLEKKDENKLNIAFNHAKKFTWKKCSKETLNVYKKVV